ncbi:MAG: serine/threonine-protein kinase [Planctomycetota bacterium]|jgi:hypothetical protein|nr:serine/threonine-protein kinase [Planctomycetota bacterium]
MPEPGFTARSTVFLSENGPSHDDATSAPASRELVQAITTSAHNRLRVLATIGFGTFGIGTILSLALPPLLGKPLRISLIFAVLCGSLTLLSLVMRWVARDTRRAPKRIVSYALSYVVVAAWAMAAAEILLRVDIDRRYDGVSGICIWIVLFPLLVPCRPLHALYTGLAAALGLPLAYACGRLLDMPAVSINQMIDWFAPPVFCAGLAFAAAWSVHRLTEALAKAREEVRAMGSYELEERLGAGGMGEVWRGRHRMLPRAAAIKFIRSADGLELSPEHSRELARRFEREARAIALLESPHTVRLYDFGIDDEARFYYAMELLNGTDLESLVFKHGPQPPERVRHILYAVCRSLSEAHDKGMVHRDIKPGNVMLCQIADQLDQVKVLDFGLVSLTQERLVGELGSAGNSGIAGTPGYIAPELVFGGAPADARSDLYAVGALGYWLLTGTSVFPTPDGGEDMVAHSIDRPPHPGQRAQRSLPDELCALVMQCLEKRPEARPESAAALRHSLETLAMPEWTQDAATAWWQQINDGASHQS